MSIFCLVLSLQSITPRQTPSSILHPSTPVFERDEKSEKKDAKSEKIPMQRLQILVH